MLAGEEYGSGSSRYWAAKGPMLLVCTHHMTSISLLATRNLQHVFDKIMSPGGESGDRQEFREDPPQQPSGNGGDTAVLQAWGGC